MATWRDICDPPDWSEFECEVELETSGRIERGRLEIGDVFFTGEDEVPIARVIAKDGREISFYDADRWRVVET